MSVPSTRSGSKMAYKAADINELQKENQCYLQEIIVLTEQVKLLRYEEDNLRDDYQKLQDEYEQLRSKISKDSFDSQPQFGQDAYWKQEYMIQKEKQEELFQELQNAQANHIRECHNIEQLHLENLEMIKREQENEVNNLQEKITELEWLNEQTINQLRIKTEQYQQAIQSQQTIQNNQQNEELNQELNKYKFREIELSNEFETYKMQAQHQINQKEQINQELLQQLRDLQEEATNLQQQLENKQSQLEEFKLLLDDQQKQLFQQAAETETLRLENFQLREQTSLSYGLKNQAEQENNQNLKETLQQMQAILNEERQQHRQTTNRLHQFQQDFEVLKQDLYSSQSSEQLLSKDLREVKQERLQLIKQIEDLKLKQSKDNKEISTEQKKLETRLLELSAENKSLVKENNGQKEKIQRFRIRYQLKVDEMKKTLGHTFNQVFVSLQLEKESVKIALLNQLDALRLAETKIVEAIVHEIKGLVEDSYQREWSQKSEYLRNQLQTHFQKSKEKFEQNLQVEMAKYEEQFKIMNKIQEDQEKQITLLEDEKNRQQSIAQELKIQLNMTKEDFKQQVKQLQGQLEDQVFEEEIKALKLQIDLLRDDNLQLQRKLDKQSHQILKQQESLVHQQLMEDITKEQVQKESQMLTKILQLERENESICQELEILRQSNLEKDIRIKLILDEKKVYISESEARFRKQFDQMKENLVNESQAWRSKLQESKKDIEAVEVENQHLKRKVGELESRLEKQDLPSRQSTLQPILQTSYRATQRWDKSSDVSLPDQLPERLIDKPTIRTHDILQERLPKKTQTGSRSSNVENEDHSSSREMHMIVAKYKYEKLKGETEIELEQQHQLRLQLIRQKF